MFGAGFYRGHKKAQERTNTRRAKVFDAFQRWKADNPYATAADFQNAVRAIGGGDLTVANSLPGQQAIQRMASENQRRKQEDDLRKKRAAISEQLQMQNTMVGLVSNAVQMYGDKVDAGMLSQQFGVPADMIQPALDQAQAKAAQAKAEKDQAAQLKALEIYTSTLNTMIANGSTPEQATAAANARSNRYLNAAGVDVSLGNVGAPSQFASNIDAANAEANALYDIRVNKEAQNAANTVRTLFANDPELRDLLLNDEQEAINAALARSGIELNDDVAAVTRSNLEASVGEIARAHRERRDRADRDEAGSVYSAMNEDGPSKDMILGDEEAARTALQNQLISGGMSEDRAEVAVNTLFEDQQPVLEGLHQDQYQSLEGLEATLLQGAAVRAQAYTDGRMKPKDGTVLIDLPGRQGGAVYVGETHLQQIERAMAQRAFADDAEMNAFFTALVQVSADRIGNAQGSFGSLDEMLAAADARFKEGQKYALPSINQLINELAQDQMDQFTSTADMVEQDLIRAADDDQAYFAGELGEVDITEAAIVEANALNDDTRARALADIRDATLKAIADTQAYMEAVATGSFNPVVFSELTPEHRLARGVEYDKEAHLAGIQRRLDDLNARLALVAGSSQYRSPGLNVNDAPPPALLPNNLTVENNGVSRDVTFSEALSAPDNRVNYFADGLEATLTAAGRAEIQQYLPDIMAAVSSDDTVRDIRVVRGIGDGLEAYDFMKDYAMSVSNAEFQSFLDKVGINMRVGAILNADDVDEAARQYARIMFAAQLDGTDHPKGSELIQQFGEMLFLLDDRSGLESRAGAAFLRAPLLDLPRMRESL